MTDLQRLCAAIVAFSSEHGLPNKVTFRELCDYYKLTAGPWESISECEILAPRPGRDRTLWDKATPADIELMKSSRPLLVALRDMLTIAQRNIDTLSSTEMVELAAARALLIKHRG